MTLQAIKRYAKKCLSLDKIILCALLVLVWGFFTAPLFIFYSFSSNSTEIERKTFLDNVSANITTDSQCLQNFYLEEDKGYCVPDCYRWKTFPSRSSRLIDGAVVSTSCIGILINTLIIIVSCMRRRAVLSFPSIFVTYMAMSGLSIYVTVLIGYLDRYKLYCVSRNLLENIFTPTPYCVIQGAVFIYGQIQLVFWWLSHVVSIMLIVFHPFKARSFLNTRKMKYIHAAITVVGLTLPAMSPLIAVSSGANAVERKFGYGVVTYPPYICSNHNREVEFYTYIFPLNLMVSSGLTCLVLLFWQLYKQTHKEDKFKITTAEKKIFASFLYYTVLQVSFITILTHYGTRAPQLSYKLYSYFLCAREYDADCEEPSLQEVYSPAGVMAAWVLAMWLPILQLVYVIDFKKTKMYICQKFNSKSTTISQDVK